jgi:hypothetical protein
MEMRREIRYRLDAPTLFSWESAHHRRVQGEGVTRDISVLGAFILTSICPPIDVPVQVEVVLPSLTGIKSIIRVSGTSRVLRVEHTSEGKGENGFAVVSEDFSRWTMTTNQEESPRCFTFTEDARVSGWVSVRNGVEQFHRTSVRPRSDSCNAREFEVLGPKHMQWK